MKRRYKILLALVIFSSLIMQTAYVLPLEDKIETPEGQLNNSNSKNNSLILPKEFELPKFAPNHDYYTPFEIDYRQPDIDDTQFDNLESPVDQELRTYRRFTSSNEDDSEIRRSITDPQTDDIFYRGDTIIVEGNLKGFAVGSYWNDETVMLFYNITESQYIGNPSYYNSNPQYHVDSFYPTYNEGNFSFSFDTSTLTSEYFSKVGDITLFTWFDGNPLLGRGNGTAGSVVVKIYGQLRLDADEDVTNPSASYSYTTRVLFDNNSVVTTQGTEYDLTIYWSVAGYHVNGANNSFDASNEDLYSNFAPGPGEQTVTYTAYYNMAPLNLNFFTTDNPTNPETDKLLYLSFSNQTEEQVIVNPFFVDGGLLTKTTEIFLDSTFEIYANLSSEVGLQPSKTIQITYTIGTFSSIEYRVTNASGAIGFTKFLPYTNVSSITLDFSIQFIALSSEFPGSTINPDSLDASLAVNITDIIITIDDPSRFYTEGQSVDYTVEVLDQFSRSAPQADFNVEFPGLGTMLRTAGVTGVWDSYDTLPIGLVQDSIKTINVTAIAKAGVGYRYAVPGSPVNSSSFNMYFVLSLTLTDPNSGNVLDGSTWTETNTTFWNLFNAGNYYNLSVVDQWGRNPIGALISISLAGRLNSTTITAGQNYVLFDKADLLLTDTPQLLSTHAYTGLTLYATGGAYAPAPSITQTITIYGPDNTAPVISLVGLNPDPTEILPHDPYFNITFTIVATDVGTGVQSVIIHYQLYEPDTSPSTSGFVVCFNIGGDNYQGTINMTLAQSQYYVGYYIEVKDYAGYGVDQTGVRNVAPAYDGSFGWQTFSTSDVYQVGDFAPPVEEQVPTVTSSPDPLDLYINITVYINDTSVSSGMSGVWLYVNRTNLATLELEVDFLITPMNNVTTGDISENDVWFYQLYLDYNYNYSWGYVALDNAAPYSNILDSRSAGIRRYSALDDVNPSISGLDVSYNGSIALPDTVLEFTVTVSDLYTDVDTVVLEITYNLVTFTLEMAKQGATNDYLVTLDLTEHPLDDYGNYSLIYNVLANDTAGNQASLSDTLTVFNISPVRPPGGITGNIGGIVGGIAGGIIGLIAVLFLWFNRHTLQTYAKKQTFRRRLRDYLREIIEDIKKDGLEGRYKEGLLKTWAVVEGIGREFFELPRYRSQTPKEFSRLLALKGSIERELLQTLLDYFEKARYGYEEITENDFNSGVRALLKIVDKIEVGEMKIES